MYVENVLASCNKFGAIYYIRFSKSGHGDPVEKLTEWQMIFDHLGPTVKTQTVQQFSI